MNWKTAFVLVACALSCVPCVGQTPPATILEIDTENAVNYVDDLADPAKRATSPAVSPLPAGFIWAFRPNLTLADIVAVNGKPAKGLFVQLYGPRVLGSAQFTPGRSIADIGGGCPLQANFMITQVDGTPIGTIMATGTTALGPPPGAPTTATAFNFAVVGGTGAFLGARGQTSRARSSGLRTASMLEDPAYRRVNGGGTERYVIHLMPMAWPEVATTAAGPAVFHASDFAVVTAEKPAQAGEWLILSATGLGPTVPGVDPGKPFPAWEPGKEHQVNTPVEVVVGGTPAGVRNAIGWPGQTNVYRVDFRVPDNTAAGTVTLGLRVAWINGPEVKIPVR